MITNYLKSKLKQLQPQFTPPITDLKDWYALSIEERTAANNTVLNQKIIRWNGLVSRADRVAKGDMGNFQVLFPHIPKTGRYHAGLRGFQKLQNRFCLPG